VICWNSLSRGPNFVCVSFLAPTNDFALPCAASFLLFSFAQADSAFCDFMVGGPRNFTLVLSWNQRVGCQYCPAFGRCFSTVASAYRAKLYQEDALDKPIAFFVEVEHAQCKSLFQRVGVVCLSLNTALALLLAMAVFLSLVLSTSLLPPSHLLSLSPSFLATTLSHSAHSRAGFFSGPCKLSSWSVSGTTHATCQERIWKYVSQSRFSLSRTRPCAACAFSVWLLF
jgi:hypothetical protein